MGWLMSSELDEYSLRFPLQRMNFCSRFGWENSGIGKDVLLSPASVPDTPPSKTLCSPRGDFCSSPHPVSHCWW
jgi:hypothetical protein